MTSQFLELHTPGEKKKKLFLPTISILSYEEMPEGKNPQFPDEGSFIRYDFGEGLAFAVVSEKIGQLKEEIGTAGFATLEMIDDAELLVRSNLIIACVEQEDEGVEATKVSIQMGGQVGSLYVKTKADDIMAHVMPPS